MSLSSLKPSDQPSATARAARAAKFRQIKDAVTAPEAPDSTQDKSEAKDDTSTSQRSSSPSMSETTLLTFDIFTTAAQLAQVPKLMVSPAAAGNVKLWRNQPTTLVRSFEIMAHLDGEVSLASQEQADLDRHAKEQASAIISLISNVGRRSPKFVARRYDWTAIRSSATCLTQRPRHVCYAK
jgi:hypothetical protein